MKASQLGFLRKHFLVEGSVDLDERASAGEVHEEHRTEPEEPLAQRMPSGVSRRVAGSDELDSLKGNPKVCLFLPEAVQVNQLSQKSYRGLSSELVFVWQVDFVAEHHQRLA